MYAEWLFFILLLAVALAILAYKRAAGRYPFLQKPWWQYRDTVVLLALGSWWLVYRQDWRTPLSLFFADYLLFILTRHRAWLRGVAIFLTLIPLLLIKLWEQGLPLILGLSFITFRAVDALVMRDPTEAASFPEYFLYLFFPPAILAGPMYRWRVFREDLAQAYARLSVSNMLEAWERVLLGIVQKFAVAQLVDVCILQQLNAADYSPAGMVANGVTYSVFLYFDFAGYSNMAIGAAQLFGFRLPANFRNPILTRNPQDFWKRWHVSLSDWLRDVVFAPLYKFLVSKGGMADHKIRAQNICIMVTLLIMGTWNGLAPHYICSGLMFGLYSVGYNQLSHAARRNPAFRAWCERPSLQALGRVLTLVLEIAALYVFSGRSPIP